MALAPVLDDPDTYAPAPAEQARDDRPWPSGWWILPAVGFGLWFWIKILAWVLF